MQEVVKLAAKVDLISDVEKRMLFHKIRNETSQAHDAQKATAVFEMCSPFLAECTKLYLFGRI
jgi:hypothetical protein